MAERRVLLVEDSLQRAGRTAMFRKEASLPARLLVSKKLLNGRIFDWGCGRGRDVEYFVKSGFDAVGWDPVHFPGHKPWGIENGLFQWVHCAFVINTLPFPSQRLNLIKEIYEFLPQEGHLALATRSEYEIESKRKPSWKKFSDGWITSRGTFTRGFDTDEILSLVGTFFTDTRLLSSDPILIAARKSRSSYR